MQTLFDNWEAITKADCALKRIGGKWLDYKQDIVGELYLPTDEEAAKAFWVLIGYYHEDHTGPVLYDLLAFRGDEDVGETDNQLLTLLNITTPPFIEYELLACGNMEIIDTGEGSVEFLLEDTIFAEVVSVDNQQLEVESAVLTGRSVDFLRNKVWSAYENTIGTNNQ